MKGWFIGGLIPVAFLSFFRERSSFQNAAAVSAFYAPMILVTAACMIRVLRLFPQSLVHQGGFLYLMWVVFFYIVGGGLICGYRILQAKEVVMEKTYTTELVGWIREFVPKRSVLLVNPRILHPAILAGRQLFLGDKRALHASGTNIRNKLFDFDNVTAWTATRRLWDSYGIKFAVEEPGIFEINASLKAVKMNARYRLVRFE
jgi:hypothetical protein